MSMTGRLALVCVLVSGVAFAGAPASSRRAESLPRICKGGSNAGFPCSDDAGCPGGSCVLSGPRRFAGTVTFVVDDNVSQFDGSEEVADVVAVTVLVELQKKWSERRLLAQTYQNLAGSSFATLVASLQAGPFIADTGRSDRRVFEARLTDASDSDLVDDFLFQTGDDEMIQQARAFYGVSGTPIVWRVGRLERANAGGSGLASLVRLKFKGVFVPL